MKDFVSIENSPAACTSIFGARIEEPSKLMFPLSETSVMLQFGAFRSFGSHTILEFKSVMLRDAVTHKSDVTTMVTPEMVQSSSA